VRPYIHPRNMLIQSRKTSPPISYYIGKERVGGNTNDTSIGKCERGHDDGAVNRA